MSKNKKLYIAATGMISPLGYDTAMSHAVLRAGHSGYNLSGISHIRGEPVTVASVPEQALDELDALIDDGAAFNAHWDRMARMAVIALREACGHLEIQEIPLLLALDREVSPGALSMIRQNLLINCKPWVDTALFRSFHFGRAAAFHALDFAFQYLYEADHDYFVVGGVDSYLDQQQLSRFAQEERLLSSATTQGFAPGEAAAFLVLTRKPELASNALGCTLALNPPGLADEPGHIYSDLPYLGEGLDLAVKSALASGASSQPINRIYSSMNGEHFWAKELGVAQLRNKAAFSEACAVEHPADCWGDLGAATGPALIAVAAADLAKCRPGTRSLIYASSDYSPRGAVVMEQHTKEQVRS